MPKLLRANHHPLDEGKVSPLSLELVCSDAILLLKEWPFSAPNENKQEQRAPENRGFLTESVVMELDDGYYYGNDGEDYDLSYSVSVSMNVHETSACSGMASIVSPKILP